MYRGQPWTMRQYAGFGTAEESNRRYKFLLASGQTGLSVAFDLPTQMGRDSDHPLARGEVGRTGVAISSIDDMHVLLDGHPARRGVDVDDHQRHGGDAARALRSRSPTSAASRAARSPGTIQNDILKEYIARGTYIYPPAPSMRLCADTFAFCQAEVPRWNTHQHQRLSHPRGGQRRRPGGRVHARRRHRLRRGRARRRPGRRRVRAAAVVLLQRAREPARGDREVPRRAPAVGADHARPLRRQGPALADAAVPRPDGGLDADRAAAAEQRRAHDDRGAGRGAGRRAVAAHQRLRRGAGAADRGVGARRAAHAADPRRRDRRRERRRSRSAAPTPSRRSPPRSRRARRR